MNEGIANGDDEFQKAWLNFTEARDILKKLQVARNFFPVVVPAQYFPGAKAQAMGKGKGKRGGGKGKGKGKKPRGKATGKGNAAGDFQKGGQGRGRGNLGRAKPFASPAPS